MKWNILNKLKAESKELKVEEIVKLLLNNRGLKTKKQVDEFLNPKHPEKFSVRDLGIDKGEIQKAIKRIKKAIKDDESIIVYGDYDADGICATAILWETLYKLTPNVLPYIPERVSEGYGLNTESIKNLIRQPGGKNLGLIITVDHGITAADKIKYAKELGIDVIVCDHHQRGKEKPRCSAVVHTDKICAAAIAWFLSMSLRGALPRSNPQQDEIASSSCGDGTPRNDKEKHSLAMTDYLDLVAIATIADLEPLIGINRSFAKFGLEALNKTKRCGLLAIFEEAGIKEGGIGTYEVGYIIAPRLNAMGRMEHALESLRLVCTPKKEQARDLAVRLGVINRERQRLTEETARHAIENSKFEIRNSKLVFISNVSYNQGIIGLVAGKLVEEFYRPAVVLSIGEQYSKASARSISGFNIIEAIRAQSDLLVDSGGHPMAAGFTIETIKIEILKERLIKFAEENISNDALEKTLKVDLKIPLSRISLKLWEEIQKLKPFGLGNPEPVFASEVVVKDFRTVGSEGKHLKMLLQEPNSLIASKPQKISAIGFGKGNLAKELKVDTEAEVAYNVSLNKWNGNQEIELKLKDIKCPS